MYISKLSLRVWAYFFDGIIVFGIYTAIISVLKIMGVNIPIWELIQREPNVLVPFFLTYGLLYFVYEVVFLASNLSATPGKVMLGIEVRCYKRGSIFNVIIRTLIKVIITVLNIGVVFFLIALFSKSRQAPHDMASDTYVIDNNLNYEIDIFEEMQKKGFTTYKEQQSLTRKLNLGGKRVKDKWIGILLIVFAFFSYGFFMILSFDAVCKFLKDVYNL